MAQNLTYNVYIDPSYTEAITGTTHAITGEVLTWQENAFNNWNNNRYIADAGGAIVGAAEGYTAYYTNVQRGGNSLYNDGNENVYVVGSAFNYIYAFPKGGSTAVVLREAPLKVYLENVTLTNAGDSGLFTLGQNVGHSGFNSDIEITIKGTRMNALVLGGGNQGDNYDNRGTLNGDITLNLSDSALTNNDNGNILFHKGNYCTAEDPGNVKITITNTFVANNIFGFKTGGSNVDYGNIDMKVTGSSVRNNIQFGSFNPPAAKSPDGTFIGTGVMTVAGSTAANVYSNMRYSEGPLANATFSLTFAEHANETQISGDIAAFDTITVNAGAKVRAASILAGDREAVTLNVAIGSALTVGTLTGVTTINVTGDFTSNDAIVISGLGEGGIGDAELYVGGVKYEQGIFPGFYEISDGNLIVHNATSTVLLVNSNYNNGQPTALSPVGYTTVANAQAAVADKDSTTIMVYGPDTSVDPNVFTSDVVTKDYSTNFSGDESYPIDFNNVNVVIGDTAADVATANVTGSYNNNINTVSFGNVTDTATVSFSHAGDKDSEILGMATFDLTNATIANLDATISDSKITDLKLADQEATKGNLVVKSSVIENVYGGAGDVNNDLTGGNVITNVFAEGQGSKIKLAGSSVGTYMAGYSQSGTAAGTLTFNDGVTAETLIIGGNANTIDKIEATITGGGAENLNIGGIGDTVSGDVDLTLAGGKFSTVSIAGDATVAGAIKVTLAGGTTAQRSDGVFQGLIYGASVTGALDGGSQGSTRTLEVAGNAKVYSVANFDALNVTGGTLNVSGGDGNKSDVSTSNTLDINGDILNRRGVNAGIVNAVNLNNYGVFGTYRNLDEYTTVSLNLSGDLNNYDFVMTGAANIGGNFYNSGRVTALGDITVNGSSTFQNDGELFFRATSNAGVFTQNGGLTLSGVDMINNGFVSAGSLKGVNNLTTSKLYVTGGAEITGNITIDAGAEVAFTNKANPSVENGLNLGGSITMGDTSSLVVSGILTTSGTKTITVNCGDLIGANEIVRAGGLEGEAGGLNDWTIKLQGANAGLYDYAKTDTSVVVYSVGELFVNSAFNADSKIVVDGNTLVFGKNAFASVADAVAAAKAGAKIVITGDQTGMDVSAAGFDVVLDNAVVGSVTAKNIFVSSDSTVNDIASASGLTIDAGALLTVTETIPDAMAIAIDASEGSGSRLVLDVDATKVTLDASKVTIIGKDSYSALVLAGEGEGAPAHAGDLYLVSADYSYYIPASFTAITEEVDDGEGGTKTVITGYKANFVDGDTFDAATGDALFADVNAFGDRQTAVDTAKANSGVFVLVDNVINNAVGEDGVISMIEVDRAKGDSGAGRAIVGVLDNGEVRYESDQDHTTMIYGSTSTGNIYGLSRLFTMNGDYTFSMKNSVTTGSNVFITGNNYGSVMNGNIDAEIVASTGGTVYIGYGSFGTDEENPIDINLLVQDSRIAYFSGIQMSGSTVTNINANINIDVLDSTVAGHFYVIKTADWVANAGANIYQSGFTAGSITVTVGGSTVNNTLRPGDSLTHGANALQVFNAPTTLHIVATEKSAITRADWVMEFDTLIIDADARLELGHNLQFQTAYRGENANAFNGHDLDIDNAGTPITLYVNMSGYEGGTHTVITAGEIYTDATMSNVSVIGDNDLTGQCELIVSGFRQIDSRWVLSRIAVFDKTDDMYVNATYNDGISGTTVGGQELFFGGNAYDNFEKAVQYASEWGGTIVVTGGTFDSQSFDGNNVDFQNGTISNITMGDRKASELKVSGGVFTTADGSGKAAMEITRSATLGDVSNFTSIDIAKGAEVAFGSVSGSNMTFFANNVITASDLNFSDATITIDVTGYTGKPHTVISTTNGITGSNVQLVGTDADKFSFEVTEKNLILKTTIASDTYLNSTYTDATTGTILEDGTYLEYGFNAFSDADAAIAGLGSNKNTLTVTGGTIAKDLLLNGANFVMDEGVVEGYIYGCKEDDFSGMNITVKSGSVGGIALTAGDGVYTVSKAAITFGDGVTVDGVISGAEDTTLTLQGSATVGGIEGMKQITISTSSLLSAGYIDLDGGTVYVTGGAVASAEGNLRKIIGTEAGITGATFTCDPGLAVYSSGKDVYLMDLTRVYFDPTYTEAITGTTMSNGDVLQWGDNAFSDLATAYDHVVLGGTLYVNNYSGDLNNPSNTKPVSYNVTGGDIANFHVLNRDNRSTAKINVPITVDIDGVHFTLTGDNDGVNDILGRSNSYTGVDQSVTYYAPITINMSNGRSDGNMRFVGQWDTIESGITLNLTNWDLRGDLKPFFGDARAAEAGTEYHSFIDVTWDNVTFGGGAKWIGLAQVTDWGKLDYINLTIKNSNILGGATGGNQNARIAAFGDGNNDRHRNADLSNGPINFTVENSQINAMLSASGLSNNSVESVHYATLFVKGGTSYVRWANWFNALDIDIDSLLTGGTVTFHDGGVVNVDAKGYTGASKVLVSLTNGFTNETDGIELNLEQDADKYQLVKGHRGIIIWDGNVTNLFYNPGYTSNDVVVGQIAPNGEPLVKTVIEDEQVVIKGNAYGEEEGYSELVAFEQAKKDLTAGNALYITGGTFGDPEYELVPLYATYADDDPTPFVNMVISNGLYGDIAIAAEGKSVTGDATLTLAGGTFGFAYEYTEDREVPVVDPETGEPTGETETQTVTLTGYTGGNISGSKDSVGGASTLNVTSGVRVRGAISDFGSVNFSANARVDGSVTADEVSVSGNARVGSLTVLKTLTVDANNNFTVDGELDAGAIVLVSKDYTGPSKIVLTASNLSSFDQSKITVDGEDTFLVKDNDLWLISEDPGNVYICTGFNDGINGTVYNGDMLFYGVNAFTSIDEAIIHTTSEYTMYVLDGNYSEVVDLTSLGKVNLQLDGGTFAGFKVGDGADTNNRSTVRITASTSAVQVGTITGIEGSTIGYRVIANKDATIGSVDGIQYLRFGTNNVTISDSVNYLTTGGELVVDLAGYTATAGASILAPTDGVNNFIQYVEGETYSNTTIGRNNNPNNYVVFYDEEAKAVKAFPQGNVVVVDGSANSTKYHGQIVEFNGQTTALVNGQNVSTWNFDGMSRQISLDGKLLVGEGYWFSNFFTAPVRNIELNGTTVAWMSAGPNESTGTVLRTGDYNFTAENSRFESWAYLAGRGTDANHMGVIIGTVDEETGEVTDGVYNITLKDTTQATGTENFSVLRYANIRGGTANVTYDNVQIQGDFQLFTYMYNYEGETLKEVNMTIKDSYAPAAKWMGIWDPMEYNQTKVNLWITDSNFAADNNDHTLGLFGTHTGADWDGEAHVYISGLTMAGRLSGARGTNAGDNAANILGTRTLHVIGTANDVLTTREFTTIDIEDGAVLHGDRILMPGSTAADAGFILRGEAGYDGDVKEYAVVGTTISGVAQNAAKFLDAEGNEIAGYKAVVGNTNVFIYMPTYDVYFNNTYSGTTTGTVITEADGKKNFLVYGDNAVNAMASATGAYAAIDRRKEAGIDATIQVMGAASNNLYTNGYKTVVNAGQIVNLIGGTAGTVTKVDSGEVDENGDPIMVDEVTPADPVASVDMTVYKGASVTNVIVASGTSSVTGDAIVTIGDGVVLGGTLNGGNEFVGGTSELVFLGGATAKAITGFDNVTLDANSVVLSGEFSGAAITIDATNFTDYTKKVLVVDNGFGTDPIAVTVTGGFGYEFLEDGKTLVVTSTIVGNAYANIDWTKDDVDGKFIGDMMLVWDGNAFNSFAAAAAVVGTASTLYLEGGTTSEDVTITNGNDVIVSANTTGTALGALTGDGGTLTVDTDFTATSISGFSGITLNAVDDITVGSMAFAEGGTLTIDMTGYTQAETDGVVLTVAGGITGITDDSIKFVGEGSGVYHAYYSHLDNSVHAMRIDNFYVDTAFGTAGEGIVEGATNAITGETLLWGVNAFYYLNDALNRMAPGQGLYINNRAGNNVNTGDKMANIYLTDSTVPVIINGFTTGDQTYVGDVSMTIKDSTFGTAAGSYLFGTVTVGEAWLHNQHIIGNLTLDVTGSTIGGANNQTVQGFQLVNVLGTEEDPALISFSFTDTTFLDDFIFIGDSPIGKTEEIEGQTYTGADVVINMTNVQTPNDKWWRIQDGDQQSEGTVTVNVKDSSFGDGRDTMRFALDNNWGMGWDTHAPRSNSDFIFNFENVEFKGYLLAGRLDYTTDRDAELTTYTGAKVLNLTGDNYISYTYWFRELNLSADATLTGKTLRMGTTGAAINIDVTGYTGCSKVFIAMDNAFENVTKADIKVTGIDPETPQYEVLTDYDETAETPAITTVVLKGAVKDIYVNTEYSDETLKLGSSYNGEALFLNENAFATAEAGLAALTAEDATLFITGGKVKTAALPANSLTIDASAQLTYNGSDVITIDGDLVNGGTFIISAGGFIDGTTTDILVLTANSIVEGEGSLIRTDNADYSISVVDSKEVHLLMKKLDVYVNTAWADEELYPADKVVDVPGGTAVIGSDAFATADAAAAKVSANGSITILASDVTFSSAITRTVIATEGSTVENANVGTGTATGSLTLQSGAIATMASVRGKGTLTVEAGAKVVGELGMLDGASVSFAEGSFLDLDISAKNAGDSAVVSKYSILTGAPTISITIAGDQAEGTYAIATDAATFNSSVTLKTTSTTLVDELKVGETVQVDGIDYTLAIDDNSVLNLTKKVFVAPITATYVSSAWATVADGTIVTIPGGTATVGYDAFATGDAAYAAVIDSGVIKVMAGEASFSGEIKKTVNVSADATLVGKAAIATAITVDGTIAFDTKFATTEAAQISGLSNVAGNTKYTLTGASTAGTYLLATDAASFNSEIAFGTYTLKLDETVIVNDALAYTLVIDEGTLAVSVAEYTPPAPETPTLVYVNSEWSGKTAGDTVTVGDKTATIGYDAFATLASGIAGVTDDGTVKVVGGVVSFADGYSKTITVDAGATVSGKATFDADITVNGTFAFDIANASADAAQFGGFSFVKGAATYTLTAAAPAEGTYLLVSGAESFTSTVQFGDVALTVGSEPVIVGDFTYALGFADGKLALEIAEYIPPVVPVTAAYVNSDWATLADGSIVTIAGGTAKIGYDAFDTLAKAEAITTVETVEVVGGEISFADGYSKTITVDAGVSVFGKATFDKDITINGTVMFDIANASADAAQFGGFSFVKGEATYTLSALEPAIGTYLLATDAAGFSATVAFGAVTLTVGADATVVGDYTYALSLTDGTLALTIDEFVPPTPTVDYVYVNSDWSTLSIGDTVTIGEKTATIGTDAFASGDIAIASVTDDGTVEVVDNTVSFTKAIGKSVVIDATATLVGKATFEKAITVNGTVAFDTAYASADAAQFNGFSFVTGDAKYTLSAAPTVGTYLLASGVSTFTSSVAFGDVTLTVGAEAVVIGEYTYALGITDNNELALVIAEKPVPPTPTELTQAYANSEWAGQPAGTVIGGATIGYDGFATLGEAEAAVTADGKVNVVGGEITFGAYSKTITVDAGATVVGKNVFDKAITINGTVAFDTVYATAEAAQISGYSFIAGSASYTLTVAAPAVGTYLLASDAASFNSSVAFGDVTLTVGAEAVEIGDFTYALGITDNNDLALVIATKPVPPTPTQSTVYVNSNWSNLPAGTTVDVKEGVTATIGVDAFANADDASKAVTEDGNIEVVAGEASFTAPITEPVTIDAAATLTGKATFAADVTVDGTVAFDTAFAGDAPQFVGFSNVDLSELATLTLAAEAKDAGTSVVLATDAESLYKATVKSADFTYTVGAPEFSVVNGVSYVLDLDDEQNLVLAYVACENNADDGWNNYLADKKLGINYAIVDSKGNAVEDFSNVLLDTKGTVYENGKYNFVSSADTADYAKITLTTGAKLVFKVDSTDKVKFAIYSLDEAKGKAKSLKAFTGTTGVTKEVYVEAGDYYVGVENKNKKSAATFYNVSLNESSIIYSDADNGDNNFLYDKNAGLNQKIDEFEDNVIADGTTELQLDSNVITGSADYSNWVGFSDVADFAKLDLDAPAALKFSVTATDKVKLVVYSLTMDAKGNWKQKALQTVTLSKGTTATSSKALLLDRLPVNEKDVKGATGYYVSVQSTNAKKGGNAYYNVTSTGILYSDADEGANNWAYDKKTNAVNQELEFNEVFGESEIILDNNVSGDYSNWVGFGDTVDFAAFSVEESGTYQFVFDTTGKAKFSVYSLTEKNGKWTQKSIASQSVKEATTGAQLKKAIALEAGVTYYVSMEVAAADAKKGADVYYNVSAKMVSAANSSALDSALIASSANTFADASAFIADSQLVDEKQAWQSVAALA